MYLFLNGILQTTVSDFNGIPYLNTNMIIGQSFIGSIGNTSFDASCKYTSDFSMLFEPFSYYPKVYDNPADSLANYVSLKIRSNKLSPQPMIEDLAKNVRFDNAVALDTSKEFLKVGAYNSSVSSYKGVSLGTQDFCIEVSAKVLSKLSVSPSLISNAETSSQWTSNIWYLLFNSSTTPNKYSFSLYSSSPWASNYPSILKEQIDLAIVREGTKLRIYVNGFLDAEYTIAANLNFDNRVGAYYSFGRDIVFNLYDLKITQGKARYTAEYEPSLIDIQDKDILAAQYRILNLPLKKVLVDYDTPMTLTTNNVGIVNKQSINGTYSGYFDGAVSSITCASWWTNKEKFSVECFLYPQEITTTVQTLYSLYSTTAELLKIGIKDGTLGYQNGANWVATTYVLDPLKFNHIVIQRNKTTLKLLADGALVATYTVPATLGTDLKFTIGASKGTAEYLKGYLNNIFVYKNYIKYEDAYEVPYEEIVPPDEGEIEPEVIVNASTTSALDFENLYLDKIPTTVWTKQGTTSNLNIVNKIFGTASFETKSLDDSLSTNSTILSGGAVPFTIEFYALIKGLTQGGSATGIWQPFLSKNVNVSNGSQVFGINNRKVYFDRGSGVGSTLNYTNPKGILISNNEINKYTISYDGSAIRIFVNNNLEYVAGTLVGLVNTAEPFRFFHNLVPSYPAYRVTTTGIIDNINIFNGIATKVREYDEYEENLIVDLAFNGENNSTKIVDNGKNEDEFYDNIISLLTFENGIQEAKGNVCTVNSGTPLFETVSPIFPNNSLNITSLNNTLNLPWTSNYNLEDKDFTIEFSVKPTGTSSGSYPALFSNRTYGSSGNNWSFLWNSGKVRAEIVTVNGSFSLTASTTMAYNTIYHIALVRKGSSLLLFLNGKIESEATIVGAMASVVAPINIGKLDRGSDSNNCVYGLYDNIRITKGVARYLSNYQVPNSNFWQKTAWGVNGDATLSTTQPFDSFSSFIADGNAKYLSTTLNLGETFTIEMEFLTPTKSDGYHIGLLDYGNGFNGANGFNVTWSSSQNIWWRSPNVNIGSSVTLSPNTVYKLTLIYANYKAQMYLNGVLVGESNGTLNTGSKFFSIGYSNTDWKQVNPYYINYCKIYNSIVLPESSVGKIQLDFDNNIIDKYKNSTWTNSGVTYDQVNSVKGFATKFSTSTYLETNSGALDFGSNSFLIDFDLKETDKAISREIFSNNIQPNSSGSIWIPSSATNVGFDFYDRPANVTGISSETLANNYYNHKILRKSGNIFKTANDCLIGIYNIPSTQTFNFVQGGLLRISKPSSIFGVVNGFNGYLDNFKSYKAIADNTVLENSITNTAVHLPLETNKENIGFTNITTSMVGSPTYTVMDSKKCIKFERV